MSLVNHLKKKTNQVPPPPACSLSKPWEPAPHDIESCPDVQIHESGFSLDFMGIGQWFSVSLLQGQSIYIHLWPACRFPSGDSNLPLCPPGHCLCQESWAPVQSCLSSVFSLFMVLGGFLKPLQNSSLLFPLQLSCRIEVDAAWRLPCCLRAAESHGYCVSKSSWLLSEETCDLSPRNRRGHYLIPRGA